MPNQSRPRFALTAFCLGMIVVHAALFWVVRAQLVTGSSDFRIFYTAGLMLRHGEGKVLYSEHLQDETEEQFAPAAVARGGPLPYNHPPFEAVLYAPLTYLPYFPAYCVWFAVNIALLAGSVCLIRRSLPVLVSHFRGLLILAPLAFFPIIYALLQGQDSILLMALYCLSFLALRRNKELQAGLLLALGLFKFHLVLPFAFVLLLHRRWRVLTGMFMTVVLEAVVSWTIIGKRQLLYYPQFVWHVNRQQAIGVIVPANMPNLRGLFTGWSTMHPPPRWVETLLLLVSVGLLVWAARVWRATGSTGTDRWNSGFSLALVATFLVGYHSYNQDMSFLLLPILLTLDRMLENWDETSVGLKITVGLMFLTPLYLFLTLQISHQNLFSILLLCFAGYLAASAATERPPASADRNRGPLIAPLG